MLFQSIRSLKKHSSVIASSLFLTLSLNLIGGTLLQAKAAEKEELATVYTKLASLHLPALAKLEMEERKVSEEAADHNKKIREANQKKIFKFVKEMQFGDLGDTQGLRYIYAIFSKNEAPLSPVTSLKMAVHQDLETNCGNDKNNPHRNLTNQICDPYVQTKFGKVQLRKMIDQPLTNTTELRNRQSIIKNLIEDESLFNQIDKNLINIKNSENNLLGFWNEFDEASEQYFGKPSFKFFLFKNLNESEQGLEFGAILEQIAYPTIAITSPVLMPFLLTMLMRIFTNDGTTFSESYKSTIYSNYGQYFDAAYNGKIGNIKIDSTIRVLSGFIAAYYSICYGLTAYTSIHNVLDFEAVTKEMQKRLISTGTFCQSALDIASSLNAKKLSRTIPSVKEIASTFSATEKTPAAAEMSSILLTETFKGEPSFFSHKGRVIHTFNQMRQLRDHFTDTMKAVGDIDAYMAIAKLYKKHASNSNAKFCFVEYVDNAITPQITLESFWNPMINPDKVVTNNVELGTNAQNPRNIIITGPNAGGKSTVLKGITLAIILGQTFGIAPANRLVFTPFNLINTYLNIADSSGVESLFQAEMRRVEELLREINSMKRNEFSYVIMDEIFTGTNPKEGMAGAYGVADKLSTYTNNISLIATHFMVLTDLAKDTNGQFANKKVCVQKNEFGKFSYLYKLENGITDQAIALDLLAQSGFDSGIMEKAYSVFNRKAAQAKA